MSTVPLMPPASTAFPASVESPATLLSSLRRLSKIELRDRVQRLTARSRTTTAYLIAHLAEVERRRLHLEEGSSSLYSYCRDVLKMSEDEAYFRMKAARVVRKYPLVLTLLASGALSLTAVRRLAPHLTPENHRELLEAASDKSARQIRELVAFLNPRPDVPGSIRKLPARKTTDSSSAPRVALTPQERLTDGETLQLHRVGAMRDPAVPMRNPIGPTKSAIEPLAPGRYKVEFTMGPETLELIEKAQNLLRSQIPSGELSQVFHRALELLVEKLERSKFAATSRPRKDCAGTVQSSLGSNQCDQATGSGPGADGCNAATETGGTEIGTTGSTTTDRPTTETATTEITATTGAELPGPDPVRRAADPPRESSSGLGSDPVTTQRSRWIPAAVKRAVWERDGGQCAFVGSDGLRCTERAFLDFGHLHPFALGGEATVDNIALRCRPHNQWEADLCFGRRQPRNE